MAMKTVAASNASRRPDALSIVFSLAAAGAVVCLVMSIVTGVRKNHQDAAPTAVSIPMPALSR